MKKPNYSQLAILLFFFATTVHGQAWRGTNRIQGVVMDQDGRAVESAVVRLRSEKAGDAGPDLKTDRRGKWAALLAAGSWNIDVEAPGFVSRQLSVEIGEGQRIPPMEIRVEKEPEPQAQPEPTVASSVPPEAVAAVQAGEAFMSEKKYKEAIVEFEKAQALLPEHMQLKQVLARAYYGAAQLKPAIALLEQVYAADPSNAGVLLLLTNLLLEDGQLDKGKAMLEKVPAGTMTDPITLVNIGILFLNKNQPADAWSWLDQAVKLDENRGESYYYRGLASLQLKRPVEARADFQKTVTLAPGTTEAADAQEMLKSMK